FRRAGRAVGAVTKRSHLPFRQPTAGPVAAGPARLRARPRGDRRGTFRAGRPPGIKVGRSQSTPTAVARPPQAEAPPRRSPDMRRPVLLGWSACLMAGLAATATA